jgi:integrase
MSKRRLTDKGIQALKRAAPGTTYNAMDAVVPGFGVRVSETGRKTFILVGRFPARVAMSGRSARRRAEREERGERENPNPTRLAIGVYGAMGLAEAREIAQKWLRWSAEGRNPKQEESHQRWRIDRARGNTFAALAEDFIQYKVRDERKSREVAREIRNQLLPHLGSMPLSDITARDVVEIIRAKAATAPAQARNLLGHVRRMFAWAVDMESYSISVSPIERVKPVRIVGNKIARSRTLSDDELFSLWRATGRLRYPLREAYRMLMLTGLRLNEVADAHWDEVKRRDGIWLIPAERMKGQSYRARAHAVPLTADIVAILDTLPTFNRGKFMFSVSAGQSPIWLTDKQKRKIDARMLRTLRALARQRGDDPRDVTLPRWQNHDIRRTVRTRLSRLKISEQAREAVLAHARPGILGTYDHHDYLAEKTEALTLWAAALRAIVEPPPPQPAATVISLNARR